LSGRPGSNRRPQPWQGCALPTELLPLIQDRVRIIRLGRYISFYVFDFCLRGLLYFGCLSGFFVYNEKLTSIFYFKPGCAKPGLVRTIPLSSSTKPVIVVFDMICLLYRSFYCGDGGNRTLVRHTYALSLLTAYSII